MRLFISVLIFFTLYSCKDSGEGNKSNMPTTDTNVELNLSTYMDSINVKIADDMRFCDLVSKEYGQRNGFELSDWVDQKIFQLTEVLMSIEEDNLGKTISLEFLQKLVYAIFPVQIHLEGIISKMLENARNASIKGFDDAAIRAKDSNKFTLEAKQCVANIIESSKQDDFSEALKKMSQLDNLIHAKLALHRKEIYKNHKFAMGSFMRGTFSSLYSIRKTLDAAFEKRDNDVLILISPLNRENYQQFYSFYNTSVALDMLERKTGQKFKAVFNTKEYHEKLKNMMDRLMTRDFMNKYESLSYLNLLEIIDLVSKIELEIENYLYEVNSEYLEYVE